MRGVVCCVRVCVCVCAYHNTNVASPLRPSPQPDYLSWLNAEGTDALRRLGALHGLRAVKEEAWVLLARKGHGALFETLITARNYTSRIVSPLTFSVALPRYPGEN